MRKLYILNLICLFLLLSIATIANSEEVIRKFELTPDKKTTDLIYYINGKEIARQTIDEHSNILKASGEIPDGLVKQHTTSLGRKFLLEFNYINGKPEGIAKVYWENGKLSKQGTYKNGKRNGLWKGYDLKGNLSSEFNYKDGKADGTCIIYRNGLAWYEYFYENGEKMGRKTYYNNGNLWTEEHFKDGKKHGKKTIYYENGIRLETNYVNGLRHGISKSYYENGKIRREVTSKMEKQYMKKIMMNTEILKTSAP